MYFKIVFVVTIRNKEDLKVKAEESSVLHFSLLQKQRKISTSTDFLPAITCTACNSRLHPSSKANCASAHPRNTGTKQQKYYKFWMETLLSKILSSKNKILFVKNFVKLTGDLHRFARM